MYFITTYSGRVWDTLGILNCWEKNKVTFCSCSSGWEQKAAAAFPSPLLSTSFPLFLAGPGGRTVSAQEHLGLVTL